MDSEKIDKLLKLHIDIGRQSRDAGNLNICANGVFLPLDSKPRFDIVFVGRNPSKRKSKKELGNWNASKTDKLLQEYIKKYGFSGAYVTDFCHFGRAESKNNEIVKEELIPYADIFKKEMEIINPKVIVCIGQDSHDLVSKYIKNESIKTIWHPGAVSHGRKLEDLKQNWNKIFPKIKTALI